MIRSKIQKEEIISMNITYTTKEDGVIINPSELTFNVKNLIKGVHDEIICQLRESKKFINDRVTFVEELVQFLPDHIDDGTGRYMASVIATSNYPIWFLDRHWQNTRPIIGYGSREDIKSLYMTEEFAQYDLKTNDVSVKVTLTINDIFTDEEGHDLIRGIIFNRFEFWNHPFAYTDKTSLQDYREELDDEFIFTSVADLAIELAAAVHDNHSHCIKFISRVVGDVVDEKDWHDPISRVMAVALTMMDFRVAPRKKAPRMSKIKEVLISDLCQHMTMGYLLGIYYGWMDPILTLHQDLTGGVNGRLNHDDVLSLRLSSAENLLSGTQYDREISIEILEAMNTGVYRNIFNEIGWKLKNKYDNVLNSENVGVPPQFFREGEKPMALGKPKTSTKKTRKSTSKSKKEVMPKKSEEILSVISNEGPKNPVSTSSEELEKVIEDDSETLKKAEADND